MAAIKNEDYIPVGPLVDYIERNYGGMTRVPAMGVWDREETADRYGTAECVERTADETRRVNRLKEMLGSANTRERTVEVSEGVLETSTGWIGLHTADTICCDYLGVHPMAVYGVEWFDFGTPLGKPEEAWVERWANGIESNRAKLDTAKVIDIRQRLARGESATGVAKAHGIGASTVRDIAKGRTWGWVVIDNEEAAA